MNRIILFAGTALALAACGSTAAAPAANGGAQNTRQRNGVTGQVSQVSASSLDVSTSSGDVTVKVAATTTYRRTASAQLGDITVGNCTVITGVKDQSGAVTATSVTLAAATATGCVAPNAGSRNPGSGNGTPRPIPSGGAGFAPPANRAIVFGAVSAVSGTQVTVHGGMAGGPGATPQATPAAIDITVTVPTTATISRSDTVTLSDVQVDDCVTANGPRASDGSMTATSVSIFPATASGCTAGRGAGRGGFGGGNNGGPPGGSGVAPPV